MSLVFGYWDVRGLGNPMRLLLEYTGVEYEDKRYSCGPPPQFIRTEYLNTINTLGLDFPNMPYLIDGPIKLTQSQVILRYLANKYDLAGDNEIELTRADLLSTQLLDYIEEYKALIINPDFLKLKGDYAKTLGTKLRLLSKFLGSNRFAIGDKVTYADFMLFEYIEEHLYFDPAILSNYPSLKQYHERILALEPIDKYFKSDRCIKFPFGGPHAFFAGSYSHLLLQQQ